MDKNKIANKIKNSSQNGEVIASIFIKNDEKLLTTESVPLMWHYFTVKDEEFKKLFPLYPVKKIDENYASQYVDAYKKTIQPLLSCFAKKCKETNYCQIYFSFNNVKNDNICIIHDINNFFILTLRNGRDAVDQMNNMLFKNKTPGQFCHALITN